MSLRDGNRIVVLEAITVSALRGDEPGILLDVSSTGARIEMGTPPPPGRVLKFDWPAARCAWLGLHGVVQWRKGRTIGLRFESLGAREICVLQSIIRHHRGEMAA